MKNTIQQPLQWNWTELIRVGNSIRCNPLLHTSAFERL